MEEKEISPWIQCKIINLATGDIIRHKSKGSEPYVVTANYGNRAIAVKSIDITNESEWEVLPIINKTT